MSMTKVDYDELVRLAGIHKEWIFGLDGNRTVASGVFGYVPVKKGTFEFVTPDTIPINIAAAIAEYERAHEPESETTIHGYSVKHLEMIAVLMRDHGITPDDVKAAARNFAEGATIAFNIANESIAKNMQDAVSRTISPYTEGETT